MADLSTYTPIYIRTTGNDAGDGSLAAPFATAQKGFQTAYLATGNYVLDLGTGSFGGVNLNVAFVPTDGDPAKPTQWPSRIAVRGVSTSTSNLGGISSDGYGKHVTITGNKTANLGDIIVGDNIIFEFSDCSITLTDSVAGNLSTGSTSSGGGIALTNSTVGNVNANGGWAGGGGVTLTDSTAGDIGASGADFSGGSVILTNSTVGTIYSTSNYSNGGAITLNSSTAGNIFSSSYSSNAGTVTLNDSTAGNISSISSFYGNGGTVTLNDSNAGNINTSVEFPGPPWNGVIGKLYVNGTSTFVTSVSSIVYLNQVLVANGGNSCYSGGQVLGLDCAGVCGGGLVVDCNGVCGGGSVVDCNGECSGSAVVDDCGICGGTFFISGTTTGWVGCLNKYYIAGAPTTLPQSGTGTWNGKDYVSGLVVATRIYIRTTGNDTTGDGSLAAPFATAQKGFQTAYLATGNYVLDLGEGSFGGVNLANNNATEWPSRIAVQGVSVSASNLGGIATAATVTLTIIGNGTANLGNINHGILAPGYDNYGSITLTNLTVGNIAVTESYWAPSITLTNSTAGDISTWAGDIGSTITLTNSTAGSITATGGDGNTGVAGTVYLNNSVAESINVSGNPGNGAIYINGVLANGIINACFVGGQLISKDCNGVCNGSAVVDCNGVCGGGAVVDDCGVCNGNNASKDCAGTCGGSAVVDDCGVCGGNNASKDCNGVCGGPAVVDDCGVCNGNNASKDYCGVCSGSPGYNEYASNVCDCGGGTFDPCGMGCNINTQDCNGGCGDHAIDSCGNCTFTWEPTPVDECGVCGGNNESKDCNGVCNGSAVVDCNGVCGGGAVVDDCGVCGGNNASKDCNGECGGSNVWNDCDGTRCGSAVVDSCGTCGGTFFISETTTQWVECLNKYYINGVETTLPQSGTGIWNETYYFGGVVTTPRNFVPRANAFGALGTDSLRWSGGHFENFVKVGGSDVLTQAAAQPLLDGKANTSHTHSIAQITGLQAGLDSKAATSHTHTISNVTGLQTALDSKQVSGSYATLVNGTVPSSQLPSYVDDVLEFQDLQSFPATGEQGKIYVALDTNKTYRWSGTAYIIITASPGSTDAIPEGSSNLYHTNARASAAAPVQSVAGKTGAVIVTKGDIGLENVNNTSDINKPISTAVQNALNTKQAAGNYATLVDGRVPIEQLTSYLRVNADGDLQLIL